MGTRDLLEGVHHVLAHAVYIGDGGSLAHPDAVIDQAAQVLAEVAVDILVDMGLPVQIVDQVIRHDKTSIILVFRSLLCG